MKLSGAVQEALLALVLYDKEGAHEARITVPSKYFDPFYSDIAEEAHAYLDRYGEPAGTHTLDIFNSITVRDPDKSDFYKRIQKSLLKTRVGINREYVLEQARVFVRHQQLKRALSGAARFLQQDTEKGVVEAETLLSKTLDSNHNGYHLGIQLQNPDQALRFLERDFQESFRTGIPALDERGLGPARKRLHVILGRSGHGKSWSLAHLAKHALLGRLRVLYVSLELSEEEVSQRLIQNFFSVSKRDEIVSCYRFQQDEEGRFISLEERPLQAKLNLEDPDIRAHLVNRLERIENRPPLVVRQFPTGGLTIAELESYLHVLEVKWGMIPDILLLDYADLMSLDRKNYRVDLGDIYKKLRGMAIKRNMAVVTASQVNRSSKSSKWIGAEDIAEDYSKVATADVVISYNQTKEEQERNLARLYVVKGRMDRSRFGIVISQNYSAGQFCLDSAKMDDSYWDSVGSMNGTA